MLQADGAHSLGDTGGFAIDDGFCGFWCDIAWGQSGAASGENEVELVLVAPCAQGGFDEGSLIGDNGARADDSVGQLRHQGADVFAAGVLARAYRAAITDGQYSNGYHV